ncbi:tRNA m(1)G methyltransferase, putative [Plasmodium malariae]|uniref:tRNA (guanine(9)-N(1))-methyltransferase n=1 Tax=Plasmodium malariae TaxID=5858 RepID=A0A1C3KCI2_PLAMA|nr:tRNA m(1)G methyltransferase, putative [Plasmodium malariae]
MANGEIEDSSASEDEINKFFSNISNVIDEKDMSKLTKHKKTKKEKKLEKRKYIKEKRKKNRPEEKKKRQKKKKQELLKILNNLNEEEKFIFLKERKILEQTKKQRKKEFLKKSFNEAYKICFNCSFIHYMGEKEISSLAKQIFLSYHYMIKHEVPVHFHFSHLNNSDELFVQLKKKYSLSKWMVQVHVQDFWEIFPKDKIVVLSPIATEDLTEIRKDHVYIISALVDRSVSKNLSFYQASLHGLETRKLPLEQYVKKKKSNVLNVNTVIEILISYLKDKDWLKVFEKCIPQKKVISFCYKSICANEVLKK